MEPTRLMRVTTIISTCNSISAFRSSKHKLHSKVIVEKRGEIANCDLKCLLYIGVAYDSDFYRCAYSKRSGTAIVAVASLDGAEPGPIPQHAHFNNCLQLFSVNEPYVELSACQMSVRVLICFPKFFVVRISDSVD